MCPQLKAYFSLSSSYPVNGGIEFASSESMVDHHKNVTGSVTKQVDPMKHTIPGKTVYTSRVIKKACY